jgi:hypothetical protein
LMSAEKTFEEIHKEMIARFQDYRTGARIASIANVPMDAALFDEGYGRSHHGATQFPWYEQVLKEWQQRNL